MKRGRYRKTRGVRALKHRRHRREVVGIFVLIGVLCLIVLGLLLYSFGFFEKDRVESFEVADECGLILGNLVHQIRDEGECRNKCLNECSVRGMDFLNFSFEERGTDCHGCSCSCSSR